MTRDEALALQKAIDQAIEEARQLDGEKRHDMGPVNWVDLCCTDIEERRSLLHDDASSLVVAIVEEASPNAEELRDFIIGKLDEKGFHGVWVETEW